MLLFNIIFYNYKNKLNIKSLKKLTGFKKKTIKRMLQSDYDYSLFELTELAHRFKVSILRLLTLIYDDEEKNNG